MSTIITDYKNVDLFCNTLGCFTATVGGAHVRDYNLTALKKKIDAQLRKNTRKASKHDVPFIAVTQFGDIEHLTFTRVTRKRGSEGLQVHSHTLGSFTLTKGRYARFFKSSEHEEAKSYAVARKDLHEAQVRFNQFKKTRDDQGFDRLPYVGREPSVESALADEARFLKSLGVEFNPDAE